MAVTTFAFSVEKFLSGLRISGQQLLQRVIPFSGGASNIRQWDAGVLKGGNVRDLFSREGKGRHALGGAALPNHRPDQITVFVVSHQSRKNQVRSFRAAIGIGAVAE